ncbi:MAG: YfaP family protein, partial [Tepidisphaerales bacterium]
SHNRTTIGGRLSNDFTQGYGPEEYCLRKAMKGQYKIQANFFGSRQQSLSGPTTLQAEVITNFGRPNEKRQAITLRLEKAKDVVDVGIITIE